MQHGCFLCSTATGSGDLQWHDRPLWLDPRAGILVAGLGGFSPGYVLVAPLTHQTSLRNAAAVHETKFLTFLDEVVAFLEERLGPLTFWEHGSPARSQIRRSACVEHAHLHIVPGILSLPMPPARQAFSTLSEALTKEIGIEEADGYMLLGSSNDEVSVGQDVMTSQYYRREWAKLVGRADEWDYLN